jgi:heptosyltransferase-2
MNPPDSVAVLRFGALGDVVLAAPALQALRTAWPGTRIIVAVKERFAHLLRNNPNVDELLELRPGEGALRFARRLRERRPGAILDLHDTIRSKLVRFWLRNVPAVVWRKRELRDTLPVKLALRPYRASMRFADRYHAAVEDLVGRELPRGQLGYFLGPRDRDAADAILRAHGLVPERPLLGISPGANWETKRWPAQRFAALARRALAAGVQVAVQGSDPEREIGERIVKDAPGAVDLCGKLDLPALGGFISRCSAFASNDSGPMHIARALGVPTLAIFGSTDPGMFEFEGHAALFAGVECAPCSFFGRARCPHGHFRCMLELPEQRAWDALAPLLRAGRRLPLSA